MPRSTPLWSSDNHDAAIPPRVRVRLFQAAGGKCAGCGRKLGPGDRWDADHIVPLILGGAHSEANLQVLCGWCHKEKSREDVALKSKSARVRANHVLPREPSKLKGKPFPKRERQRPASTPIDKWSLIGRIER